MTTQNVKELWWFGFIKSLTEEFAVSKHIQQFLVCLVEIEVFSKEKKVYIDSYVDKYRECVIFSYESKIFQ